MGIVLEKVEKYLAAIKRDNQRINAVLEVNPRVRDEAKAVDAKKQKGKLYGYVFGIKSNINVTGLTASCASKTLENYVSTYDATVIQKIKQEDGVIIGMLNCDEFACGVSGETSAFGPTENPAVLGHVPGGSSSGSAAAVAAGFCDVALGSDTGGSIRVPASFCGVVGVKPSYGLVSRHGLIDLSMSLDQIGPLAHTVSDAALVLDVIAGKDEQDTTSVFSHSIRLTPPEKITVGVLRIAGVNRDIAGLVEQTIATLCEKHGWEMHEIAIEYIDLSLQAYHVLCWTEFFSATRRFDGRRYGAKIEDVCGSEVLRRLIGGGEIAKAEFKGQYYDKAQIVKKTIAHAFRRAFEKVECIMLPTAPVLPWRIGAKKTVEEMYATDTLVIPANLAGICSVSVPIGALEGKPVGMQIMCAPGKESTMLSIAQVVEQVNSYSER